MTTQTKWTPGTKVTSGQLAAATVQRIAGEHKEMAEVLAALFENCVMIHKHWGEGSNAKAADEAQSKARALLSRLEAV